MTLRTYDDIWRIFHEHRTVIYVNALISQLNHNNRTTIPSQKFSPQFTLNCARYSYTKDRCSGSIESLVVFWGGMAARNAPPKSTSEAQFRKLLVALCSQTRRGTESESPPSRPYLWRAELLALHPVSDVITVHLMHPVGRCLGACLPGTAKSLHSIFHIAKRFCLPTGTTYSTLQFACTFAPRNKQFVLRDRGWIRSRSTIWNSLRATTRE